MQRRNLARRGLGEVRGLDRADHLQAVARREVGEGVVVGDQFALLRRDGRSGDRDRAVQLAEAGGEALRVGAVDARPGGVQGDERVAHDLRIDRGEVRGGPEVRIGVAFGEREGEVEHVLPGADRGVAEQHDRRALAVVRLGELERRQLQIEAVDDDQVGALDVGDSGGRRLEGVAVRALRYQRDDPDAIAADVLDDVAQRGDGSDDEQAVVLSGVAPTRGDEQA